MSSPRKIFVTTALPYANGPFHVGHIMEYIQADIWVRFQRMQGNEVHFVGADDAHGAPIMLAAEKAGKTPEEFVAGIAAGRKQYLDGFHIKFDHWHSTHSPENTQLSQDIYKRLSKAGLIYKKPVEQFYDPVKGMFLADRYILGECPKCGAKDQYGDACENCSSVYAPTDLINPYSTLSGAAPVRKSSEHYFFKLSDESCVAFLRDWIDQPQRLQSQVANKAREWLDGEGDKALGDWDISRDAPYFGIEIPDAPGKYFYVWLDAPIGYLASFKAYCAKAGIDFEAFLADENTEQVHFIGKDIIYFHTLFWPAMLKYAGPFYKVPTNVFVHGFINVSGEKMSKSRGTGISPLRYLDLGMNPEWLRYYIAAKLNANVEDLDFNPDDFIARVNSDLVGKYINIASRCAGFLTKRFEGRLLESGTNPVITEIQQAADYFAAIPWSKRVRVVESALVPKTRIAGNLFLATGTALTEPIAGRIIEVPEDEERTEQFRDPRVGFVAYVPPGSLERGRALVDLGGMTVVNNQIVQGRTTACTACHGLDLMGVADVPPIAGRSPSYIARQLFDIQQGTRNGPNVQLMKLVVTRLTPEDMVDVAAYVASRFPPVRPAPALVSQR